MTAAPCGSGVVRIDPLRFLPGCRTRWLNQVWILFYILACVIIMVLLFIRTSFYVSLVFVGMCSVFWLFWLSYRYLPSDWLESLLWGSLIVVRGSSPESPGRRVHTIFLVYCIASLFYYVFVLSPAPTWYIILLLWCDIAICAESAVKPQANKQTSEISALFADYDIYIDGHGQRSVTACVVFYQPTLTDRWRPLKANVEHCWNWTFYILDAITRPAVSQHWMVLCV